MSSTRASPGIWFTSAGDDSARSRYTLGAFLASLLGVGALGGFFTRFMHRAVYIAQLVAAALFFIHAVILLASDSSAYWPLAAALLLIAVGDSLWLVRARERLEFVEVFLDVIVTSVRRQPWVLIVAVGASAAQAVVFVAWANAVCTVLRSGYDNFGTYLGLACLFFMLRWWLLIIANIVFITAGGTFAAGLVASASATPPPAGAAPPPSPPSSAAAGGAAGAPPLVGTSTVLHFLLRAVTRSLGTVIVGPCTRTRSRRSAAAATRSCADDAVFECVFVCVCVCVRARVLQARFLAHLRRCCGRSRASRGGWSARDGSHRSGTRSRRA
jgi:hypothetical protein